MGNVNGQHMAIVVLARIHNTLVYRWLEKNLRAVLSEPAGQGRGGGR